LLRGLCFYSEGLLVKALVLNIELAWRYLIILDFWLRELVGALMVEFLYEVEVDRLPAQQLLAVGLGGDLQVLGRVVSFGFYLDELRVGGCDALAI
jgi:hypothetical protein